MAKSLPKKRVGGIKSHFSFYEKIRTYDSHNKNVAQSLESLVFSRTKAFKQSLTKKRLVIASSSLVVLIVLGTYFAPKGAAESAIFYPTSCLGGWMNPSLAQGQPETTSNDDVSQFNPDNSAVLAANTNADIYCGSFTGTFPEKTKPTKILISLSWAQAGNNAVVSHQSDQNIVGESFASSSLDILDSSSTDASNPVTFTATTTSDATDTSSGDSSNTPLDQPSTQTPTEETPTQAPDTTTPATESTPPVDTSSPQGNTGTSDTPAPTSFIDQLVHHITSLLFEKAYAQDATGDTPLAQPVDPAPVNTQTDTQVTTPDVSPSNPEPENTPSIQSDGSDSSTTVTEDTTTPAPEEIQNSTSSTPTAVDVSTTTDVEATTTEEVASTTDKEELPETKAQNSFLEILYTFDGITWNSLGTVNETDMVSRNFEVPVDASTTWDDMSHLQVKVQTVQRLDQTPLVYLDGMQAEVMYENVSDGSHPDFSRDTILQETKDNGIHAVLITNADSLQNEIWYMLEEPLEGIDLATSTWYQFGDLRQWPTPATILYSLQDHSPPGLSKHIFDRQIVIDPKATHSCRAENFRVDISGIATSTATIFFKQDEQAIYKAEIGSLPDGVDVKFVKSASYEDYLTEDDTSLDLQIVNQDGSSKGNFTVPIIFTKNLGGESVTLCQINLVNL